MLLPENIALGNPTESSSREHESLMALRDFWESKKSGRTLPSKADFPPSELKQWLGHIALVDVEQPSQRLRMRLMGVDLVHYAGTDYTGRWIDECFSGDKLVKVMQPYHGCLDTKTWIYDCALQKTGLTRRTVLHRLHLPLAADGITVDTILGCGYAVEEHGDFRALAS